MAITYRQLGLLAGARGEPAGALGWMVRCIALFDEFPHPATGQGPDHLARLMGVLGVGALEACWLKVTGSPLPAAVREYVVARSADGHEEGSGDG